MKFSIQSQDRAQVYSILLIISSPMHLRREVVLGKNIIFWQIVLKVFFVIWRFVHLANDFIDTDWSAVQLRTRRDHSHAHWSRSFGDVDEWLN